MRTTKMRAAGVAALTIAALVPMSACSKNGGGGNGDYCASVKKLQGDFTTAKTKVKTREDLKSAMGPIVEDAKAAANSAPDGDAKDVWNTFAGILEKAGNGDISALQSLQNDKNLEAKFKKVGDNVKSSCGVDLTQLGK